MAEARFHDRDGGYGTSTVDVWWWRWSEFAQPGRYLVTFGSWFGPCMRNFNAVVDDFGTLVEVPR